MSARASTVATRTRSGAPCFCPCRIPNRPPTKAHRSPSWPSEPSRLVGPPHEGQRSTTRKPRNGTTVAEEPERSSSSIPKLIVALGASGARTASLERLIARLGPPPDAALIIVLQHREALDEAVFRAALAQADGRLAGIVDGAAIEAGRIYLPTPDTIVEIEEGRFRNRPAENRPGERGTIDSLLVSLSRNEDFGSVAVLLHGTGGDGTLGVNAIKEAGGLTLAEPDPDGSGEDLDRSSSPAALADFVAPADALAERIAQHLGDLRQAPAPDPTEVAAALTSIAGVLRNQTGHDFHGYKQGTFLRRVQRRMQVVQVDTIGAYVGFLRGSAEEAQALFNDLLIGVTQFFRDKREFELIETQVIPKLFEGKKRGDQLRVWVIGCSTGEEAYSLAILLREQMAKLDEVPQVQIFATDIDGRA
ncbi:MAG: hypothetical protein JO048_16550, partial [Methylobacteriaceae bacterium]|nr:hypothetical protein [Methylobacteriaceae bacterium]